MHIGIICFSGTGVTQQLSRRCADGIRDAGGIPVEWQIEGQDIVEGRYQPPNDWCTLNRCSGIVFAAPTYMGGPAAEFKAFADKTSEFWIEQRWANKLAAGITSGTGLNGDQSSTLQYFCTFSSQHGMLWVNLDTPYNQGSHGVNRLGTQLGVVAQNIGCQSHPDDTETAYYLGKKMVLLSNARKAN